MIASLRGAMTHRDADSAVIEVKGVGYEVLTTGRNLDEWANEDAELMVWIRTIVREDAFILFGFSSHQERALFNTLIGINKVGPKLALATLDTLAPDELAQAVHAGDFATLSRVPGVGKKTAQRMVLELKDKLSTEWSAPGHTGGTYKAPAVNDPLKLALARLGYTRSEISTAINCLEADGLGVDKAIGTRIRAALKVLS